MQSPRFKDHFIVNKTFLPIKIQYFFLYGGAASTLIFFPLIAKNLGFDATASGIIFTVIPFFNLLAKMMYGYITDFLGNIKPVLMILVVMATSFSLLILLVPELPNTKTSGIQVVARCVENASQLIISSTEPHSEFFLKDQNETLCHLTSRACFDNRVSKSVPGELTETKNKDSIFLFNDTHQNSSYILKLDIVEKCSQPECDCLENKFTELNCSDHVSISASSGRYSTSVYLTYNFWLLLILLIMATTSFKGAFCLSDGACYEILGEQKLLFGRQILWGTVSSGIVTLAVGYFNDIATGDSVKTDYSPVFYTMSVFMIVDLAVLYKSHLVKSNISKNILKDVSKIFTCYKTFVFAISAYMCGGFNGFIWHYQFWYLQDLGASQTLLGLVTAVQCLASEVPFSFFSGWLIKKWGHFNCMFIGFLAFSLRLGLHAVIKNPWFILLVELLHGTSYSLPFATITDFVTHNALSGSEVTNLGVLEGIYLVLGVATGTLLGGLGYDRLGESLTFFTASIISLVCAPLLAVASIFIKKTPQEII